MQLALSLLVTILVLGLLVCGVVAADRDAAKKRAKNHCPKPCKYAKWRRPEVLQEKVEFCTRGDFFIRTTSVQKRFCILGCGKFQVKEIKE